MSGGIGWSGMDGILSKGFECWYDYVLTSLGDSEVLREVVRSVAMMGSSCLARYVRDRSLLQYISLSHYNCFVDT